MRENARSRGRWSKQQEIRRQRLSDLANDELIRPDDLDRLCKLESLRERYLKLQHPRSTREMKAANRLVEIIFGNAFRFISFTPGKSVADPVEETFRNL